MSRASTRASAALTACMASLLAACATPPAEQPVQQAAAQPPKADPASDRSITGSRMPTKTSDRFVKQIGSAGIADMNRERPPNPGEPNR